MTPTLEALEARNAPSGGWSGAWLTWSFVPDGTQWSGGTSTLNATLGGMHPAWREAIRSALRQWSVATGLMLSEVPDPGNAIGTAGGGTVRIGGVVDASSPNVAGWAYFPEGSPIAGDVTLNLVHDWTPSKGLDVFSVALHELGHSFGLGHSSEPDSVMGGTYRGPVAGLGVSDVAAAKVVYDSVPFSPAAVFNKIGRFS